MAPYQASEAASKASSDSHQVENPNKSMATEQHITMGSLLEFHKQHFPDVSVPDLSFDATVAHQGTDFTIDEASPEYYHDGEGRYLTEDQVEYLRYREVKAALEGKTLEEALDLEEGKPQTKPSHELAVDTASQPKKKKRRRHSKRGPVMDHERSNENDHTPNRLARELDEMQHKDIFLDY